jgi:shikimate kinase
MSQIYLIGFMGTGKSTVARELSARLKRPLLDTDEEIVKTAGISISDYFAKYGEAAFRNLEHQVLEQISAGADAVISCGGGVALRQDNVACMKHHGTIFLLTATPETILARVRHDTKRPLLQGKKNVRDIGALMEQRVPFYQQAADHQVATDRGTPQEIANEIAKYVDNPK